jgi:SprB-like repeat protein
MEPKHNKYPIFEANQVLTNSHLNNIFEYLDEQERLTRARLIGIGIVCGLEIRKDVGATTTIHLSKGCGVSSKGYLILEPEDVTLTSYRAGYVAPDDPDDPGQKGYAPFNQPVSNTQYPLWELFPAGEPNTTPLGTPAGFLNDKVVVLFLELKKDDLRNCSPNNCDDKGAEVTATARRLLITRSHLEDVIAVANGLSVNLAPADLAAALTAKLGLKDIRQPRYDAPNTTPVTSEDVLIGFFETFRGVDLAEATGNALTAAYTAFKPLLKDLYPVNPFADLPAVLGFLDSAPQNAAQVRFLQYYYDLFDDLIRAYDEFRWAAAELLCACCPSQDLFPRHLMLGELSPSVNAALYRQTFLASPAVSGCEQKTNELRLLFQRLVEMTRRFTNNPPLPEVKSSASDAQIRITPSKLADAALSAKCIPYYYTQNGNPPLYKLWNPEKTRRGRANQNLSYRADEYASELFVRNPLRYDLEPYNFLRIEGHLGKNYRTVMQTLLAMKSQYRLPIEIVALRTGAFDENMTVDLSKEECRFQDLESLYRTLREELRCFLCKEMQFFYGFPFNFPSSNKTPYSPQEPLLKACAPTFKVNPQTIGDYFESLYNTIVQGKYYDPDVINLIGFIDNQQGGTSNLPLFYLIYYPSKLAETLPEELSEVDFTELENRYGDLEKVADAVERYREEAIPQLEGASSILNWEELDDRIEAIMYACRWDAFKAIRDEYARRILDLKQRQFLSFFLQKHPGIQHKAGVPLGGTFIIVYHDDPDPVVPKGDFNLPGRLFNLRTAREAALTSSNVISGALNRLRAKKDLVIDPDIQLIFTELTGQIPTPTFTGGRDKISQDAEKIFADTVNQLADGTVIADFFLPYLCCSDCAPVQFVLPPPPIGFAVELGCTKADGRAEATITPQGGAAPYTIQLDNGAFQPLTGKPALAVGDHTIVIRDSAGVESAPQSLTVPAALVIGAETFTEDIPKQTYQVSFKITGGAAPYTADSGVVDGDTYTSAPVKSDESIKIAITDSAGCKTSKEFTHKVAPPCDLPCKGIALRCGFRFWMPEPEPNRPYNSFDAKVPRFVFDFPQGTVVDLTREVQAIIKATPDDLNRSFNAVVKAWLARINKLITDKAGSNDWLKLDYVKLPTEPIGTLIIEYFECLNFGFQILPSYQRPEIREGFDMNYTPKGVEIQDPAGGRPIIIPPFNCLRIDKCDPQRPTVDLCKGVDMSLKIGKKFTNGVLSLNVTSTGTDTPETFLWEVQDGIPAVSNEKQAEFKFTQIEPTTKSIRVSAFTKKGCRVIAEDSINIRG